MCIAVCVFSASFMYYLPLVTSCYMSQLYDRYDSLYRASKLLNEQISLLVTVNIGFCGPIAIFEALVSKL